MTNPRDRFKAFTTDELWEELTRRRRDGDDREPEEKPRCDECGHHRYWTKPGDPPSSWNPCSKGHALKFEGPNDWDGPHQEYVGFYRTPCEDRIPIPPPPRSTPRGVAPRKKP